MKKSILFLAMLALVLNGVLAMIALYLLMTGPGPSSGIYISFVVISSILVILSFAILRTSIACYRMTSRMERTERNFELTVSNIKDYAIFMIDTTGRISTWNQGAAKIKGYDAREILGKPIDHFYTAEDRAKGIPQKNLQLTLEKGFYETRGLRLRKDGTSFYADITFIALYDEEGRHYGFLKFTRDITERRKDEERIRFLATIANNIPDPVISTDHEFKVTRWNDGATKAFGWKAADAIGRNITDLLQPEYPGDNRQKILYILKEEHYWHGEMIYHHALGQEKPVLATMSHLVNEEGKITGYLVLARDISERKKAEEALNRLNTELEQRVTEKTMMLYETEKQLRVSMDNMLEGIQILDFGWHYRYVNHSVVQQSKFPRDALLGHTMMEVYPGIDQTPLFASLQECMNLRQSRQMENEFRYPDGSVGYFQLSVQPVPEGLFILSIDISEKKKAELQALESQENLRAIFENSSEGFLLTDRGGTIKTFNNIAVDRMKFITGREMKEGVSVFDFVNQQGIAFFQSLFERVLSGETVQYDQHYKLPEDQESWINFSFNPVREDDRIVGMCVTGRDITLKKSTERQQREMAEKMSAIINTLPANIALLDEDGTIVEVNDAWKIFAEQNNYNRQNYYLGDNYLDAARRATGKEREDGENVARGIQLVLNRKIREFVYEYPCHAPDRQRWFRMIVTALEEKKYAGAVVMHIDISEIKRLEDERLKGKIAEQKKIAQAILMTQEAERDFMGKELHDNINQILASAKLYLGAASRQNEDVKELSKYPIDLIDKGIQEIRQLSKRSITPPRDISLKEHIESLLDTIRENSDLQIELHYHATSRELSAELKLNIYRMMQEQMNNILKHANARSVRIEIRNDDRYLTCITTDDGRGFDIHARRSGIGMTNMQNRLQLFNGTMEILSEPGKGCTIAIVIPLQG